MDAIQNKDSKFWDRMADGYSKKPVADEAVYQHKLEKTREYLQPHMEVLEFGCGTGSTAIAHAPFVKHILATDISQNMLDIAKRKADESNVRNVTFECGAIDGFNAPDETFDVVMGHSILHLLNDKDAVIATVHRMLKRGGVFVSSTACIADMGLISLIKYVAPIGKALGALPQVKVFTIKELEDSLVKAGFTIDHQWQPGKGKAVFIVAKKSGSGGGT